jgi:hypothetical protein
VAVGIVAARSAAAPSSAAREMLWARFGWIAAIAGTSIDRSERQPASRSAVGDGPGVGATLVCCVAGDAVGSCVGAVVVQAAMTNATSTPADRRPRMREILRVRSIVGNPRPV